MHIYRVIHGGCVYILPTVLSASVSLLLTDPPYVVSYTPRDA